jgi:hypothetical protein
VEELSIIFSSPPTRDVYYIVSIAFMLFYAIGFFVLHRMGRPSAHSRLVRHGIPAFGAVLIAAVVGLGAHWTSVRAASAGSSVTTMSVSPEALHRAIDPTTLPVLRVRDPF